MVQISFAESITAFRAQLGLIRDRLNLSLAALEAIDEATAASVSHFRDFIPSDVHLSFTDLRENARQWQLQTALGGAITLTHQAFDECLAFAAVRSQDFSKASDDEILAFIEDRKRAVERLSLPEKLKALDDLGLRPFFAEHLLSINRLRNCLFHRGGIVGNADLQGDNLRVIFRAFRLLLRTSNGREIVITEPTIAEEGGTVLVQFYDHERVFSLGERVNLTREESVALIMTVSVAVPTIYEALATKNLATE